MQFISEKYEKIANIGFWILILILTTWIFNVVHRLVYRTDTTFRKLGPLKISVTAAVKWYLLF